MHLKKTPKKNKRAVLLLSGGLDSTTLLAAVQASGYQVIALTISYGQRHQVEIKRAVKLAKLYKTAEHLLLEIPRALFAGSALTGFQKVPKNRALSEIKKGIPVTYVPARNTLFLSFALSVAESRKCRDIFIGANVLDYSGYPDCRPAYFKAFERMAKLATKAGVEHGTRFRIQAPFLLMTKAQIIKQGLSLGVDYALTHSCYDPDSKGRPCRRCDSCLLRAKGFKEAGVEDPSID